MMQSLKENKDAITLVLAENNKTQLIFTSSDIRDIYHINKLLRPFKDCGEKLSSESNVTISLISPLFEQLKQHLSASNFDPTLIQNMKTKMLAKMNTRYSSDQMKILKTCTLLDIRYKSSKYLANDFDQLEKDVKEILWDQKQQS